MATPQKRHARPRFHCYCTRCGGALQETRTITKHLRRDESAQGSSQSRQTRICYCSLHPQGVSVSRSTAHKHARKDGRNGVASIVPAQEWLSDEELITFGDDISLSDSELLQPTMQDQTVPEQDIFLSDVDMDIGDDATNNSEVDWNTMFGKMTLVSVRMMSLM